MERGRHHLHAAAIPLPLGQRQRCCENYIYGLLRPTVQSRDKLREMGVGSQLVVRIVENLKVTPLWRCIRSGQDEETGTESRTLSNHLHPNTSKPKEHSPPPPDGGGRQEAQASPGAGDHHQMMRQDGLDCQMFYQTAVASTLLCSGLCGAGSIKRGGLPSVAEQHSISGAALVTGCCLCPAPLTD